MENKPICEIDEYGDKRWKLNGELHHEDGPAIECVDGHKEWWVNGYHITFQIRAWAEENGFDLDNLPEADKILIKLIWADYRK